MATIERVIFLISLLTHDTTAGVREDKRPHCREKVEVYRQLWCDEPGSTLEELPCGLVGRNRGRGACCPNVVAPSEEAKTK